MTKFTIPPECFNLITNRDHDIDMKDFNDAIIDMLEVIVLKSPTWRF